MVTVKELRSLFPAIIYSQSELAEIVKQSGEAIKIPDLLKFVKPDYKREDERILSRIETARGSVRAAIQDVSNDWEIESQVRKLTASRDSLIQRTSALTKILPKLSEENQGIVDFFQKRMTSNPISRRPTSIYVGSLKNWMTH
jgi:type III restriction enzyme